MYAASSEVFKVLGQILHWPQIYFSRFLKTDALTQSCWCAENAANWAFQHSSLGSWTFGTKFYNGLREPVDSQKGLEQDDGSPIFLKFPLLYLWPALRGSQVQLCGLWICPGTYTAPAQMASSLVGQVMSCKGIQHQMTLKAAAVESQMFCHSSLCFVLRVNVTSTEWNQNQPMRSSLRCTGTTSCMMTLTSCSVVFSSYQRE